ncbi:hypothetical protein [Ruminococcus flavefaciens]|uniref:hypothetical protein n=1 Tax=Ruminococcus flavefaciens TaxID=1265 RepID=UPI0003165C51|nr:hypothetical protein [Ruminococcus flavefaciens]
MKRIIAGLIALTAVICSFTGCTDKKGSKDTGSGSTQNTASASENTEGTSTGETDPSVYSSQEEAIMAFIEAFNARDYRRTFDMQMPDDMGDVIRVIVKSQKDHGIETTEEELIKSYQYSLYYGDEDRKIRLDHIISSDPADESELADLKENFGMFGYVRKYIADKGGVDKVDSSELDKEYSAVPKDKIAEYSGITDAYCVVMELENEVTGDMYEGIMYVLGYNGGWKINAQYFRGVEIRARSKTLTNEASMIYKAAMTSLVEMEAEDSLGDTSEGFIIHSDESRDHNVPQGFDTESFRKKLKKYYENENERRWFVEIKDGAAAAAAVWDPETPGFAGIYSGSEDNDGEKRLTGDKYYEEKCRELDG